MLLSLMLVANMVMLGITIGEQTSMGYMRAFIIVGFIAFLGLALGEAYDMIFVALLGATYQGAILLELEAESKIKNSAYLTTIRVLLVGTPFIYGIIYLLTSQ